MTFIMRMDRYYYKQ